MSPPQPRPLCVGGRLEGREAFFSGKSVKIPFKTNDCRALDWWGYRVPKGGKGERGGERTYHTSRKNEIEY